MRLKLSAVFVIVGSIWAQGAYPVAPQATFASPPSSPATGAEYTFTDASATGVCTGGGSSISKCRWSGSAWQTFSGSGSMTYPGSGVANSTGSAWGTSYTVGTGGNNLVQLDGSGNLPAVPGAALTGLNATQVGLGNVTNDVQTKAAIVPNTAPAAGQIMVGNAGGTAYAPVTATGCTISSAGVISCPSVQRSAFQAAFVNPTVGALVYSAPVPAACTIQAWSVVAIGGSSPTFTADVWKIANGSALPTVANTITASALPALATGNALQSSTLTGWTTSVSQYDLFAAKITAVSGAPTQAIVSIYCK